MHLEAPGSEGKNVGPAGTEVAASLAREEVCLRSCTKMGTRGMGDEEQGSETEAELVGLAQIWRGSQPSV